MKSGEDDPPRTPPLPKTMRRTARQSPPTTRTEVGGPVVQFASPTPNRDPPMPTELSYVSPETRAPAPRAETRTRGTSGGIRGRHPPVGRMSGAVAAPVRDTAAEFRLAATVPSTEATTATVWRLMPGPRLASSSLSRGGVLLDEPAFQLMRRCVARRGVHPQSADEVAEIVAGLRRGVFLDEPRPPEHVLVLLGKFLEVVNAG